DSSAPMVTIELNQSQLAEMAGGSRQSVNQAIGSFANRGWLRTEGRRIVVTGLSALRRRAGLRDRWPPTPKPRPGPPRRWRRPARMTATAVYLGGSDRHPGLSQLRPPRRAGRPVLRPLRRRGVAGLSPLWTRPRARPGLLHRLRHAAPRLRGARGATRAVPAA